MKITTYNKLIRDKIPEIIAQSGKKAIIEQLTPVQYARMLDEKLAEELAEYHASGSVEELADLVEVILAILEYKEVTYADFERIRKEKNEERGGFRERLLLKEVREEV
jgi:predicted house-cleaning noncanonical NTP pyrophosphatase (MazG superfamily)